MQHPHVAHPTPNHVRAVFNNRAAVFDLPRVTSFEHLAEQLCSLGERYGGAPTRIDFVTDPSSSSDFALAAIIRQLTALDDEISKAADE